MKRLIQIMFLSIALIYLGGMIYQVGYFAYFKVNQESIIAEYCVNKDNPEMECNGHCHLKKQLQKVDVFHDDDQSQREEQQTPQFELDFLIAILPFDDAIVDTSNQYLVQLEWRAITTLCCSETVAVWHPPKV